MNARHAAIIGLVIAVIGGILAFSLKSPDTSAAGLKLQPLGAVLLAAGALIVAAAGFMSLGEGGSSGSRGPTVDGLRTLGSLIAVVSAIIGVVALAVVTQQRLGGDKASSIVAIATAAFGVISAVVGAYLGIKVTADQSAEVQRQAQDAHIQLGAATAVATGAVPEDQQEDVKKRMASAAQEAVRVGHTGRD